MKPAPPATLPTIAGPDWRQHLHRLEGHGLVLLPIGAMSEADEKNIATEAPQRKVPVDPHTGRRLGAWQRHPGFTAAQIAAMPQQHVIGACINTGPSGLTTLDLDGPAAVAHLEARGLNPRDPALFRIVRTTDPDRFKIPFRLTPEQRQRFPDIKTILRVGEPDAEGKRQALEIYAKTGAQVICLGFHTKSGGWYDWAGDPSQIGEPSEAWLEAMLAICAEVEALRGKGDPTRPPRTKGATVGKGDWKGSSKHDPCPVCGRDHSSACTTTTTTDGRLLVSCFHGGTFSAPEGLKAGDVVPGLRGGPWAFIERYYAECIGEKSLFIDHQPLANPGPPAPGDVFIPAHPPTSNGNGHHPENNAPDMTAAFNQDDDDDQYQWRKELDRIKHGESIGKTLLTVLPPSLADLFRQSARSFPVAPEMLVPPFLAISASIFGKRGKVLVKGSHKEPLVFWFGTIAEPSAMKSPVAASLLAPLQTLYEEVRAHYQEDLNKWNAAIAQAQRRQKEIEAKRKDGSITEADEAELRELEARKPDMPELREFFIGEDISWEQIGQLCAREAVQGLVMEQDELEGWLRKLDREPELRPKWLRLWGAGHIKQDYKTVASAYASQTAISIMGNTTPDNVSNRIAAEIAKAAEDATGTGDGMWPRMLWCKPPHVPPYYSPVDKQIGPELLSIYRAIDSLASQDITITDDARKHLVAASDDLVKQAETDSIPIRQVFIGKLRGYLWRFAGLLSVIDRAWLQQPFSGITLPQAERAVLLSHYFLGQFDAMLPLLGRSTVPHWVMKVQNAAKLSEDGCATPRDLARRHNISAKDAHSWIVGMAAFNLGRVEQVPINAGRTRVTWFPSAS